MNADDPTAEEEFEEFEAEMAADPVPTPEELGIALPDDPQDAISTLLAALGDAYRESAGYRDGHLRALAEMDNVRKRSLRDRTVFIEQATERIMHKLLPVLDSFQAGLDSLPASESERRLLDGVRQTYDQLADVLASEGLTPIEAEGEPFDPTLHEAISVLGDGDHLVVHHQVRRGFRLKERVLRPATVVVGPAGGESDEA